MNKNELLNELDREKFTFASLKKKGVSLGTLTKRFRCEDYQKFGIEIKPFVVWKKSVSPENFEKHWKHLVKEGMR